MLGGNRRRVLESKDSVPDSNVNVTKDNTTVTSAKNET